MGKNELSDVRGEATGKTYHCGGREERTELVAVTKRVRLWVMASLPSPAVLADAANLHVFDLNGQKVHFGSLFESKKSIFVFIRSVLFFLFLKFTISSFSVHL